VVAVAERHECTLEINTVHSARHLHQPAGAEVFSRLVDA
jgi:hypothetical protein